MGCILINRACLMDRTLIALREESKLLSYEVLFHQLTALVFWMFHLLLKQDVPRGIPLHLNEAYLTRISACAANLLSLQDRYGSWETSVLEWRLGERRQILIAPELSEIFICVSLSPYVLSLLWPSFCSHRLLPLALSSPACPYPDLAAGRLCLGGKWMSGCQTVRGLRRKGGEGK